MQCAGAESGARIVARLATILLLLQACAGSAGHGGAAGSGGTSGVSGAGGAAGGAPGSGGQPGAGGAPGIGGAVGGTGGTTGSGGAAAPGGAGGAAGLGGAGGAAGIGGAGGSTSITGAALYDAIDSGSPWLDDQGNVINAHGAGIIKDNGKYYLFGERHSDTSNAFTAFSCYSSVDLLSWKLEGQVLPMQPNGILGPNRVGERAKVMKCPSTGEYVMFMHTDNLTYTDEAVAYATSATINGAYSFKGALQFNGASIARWDMGTFQDTDGSGYILANGGDVYKLAADYHSAASMVAASVSTGGESPAMFKAGNVYFFLFSNKTSWERNDNYYYTATSIAGPWTNRGLFAPSGTLTWNSQTTFVLPVVGSGATTYMFMGDRWSYPRQGSAATSVWQPLAVSGTTLSMPAFNEAWKVNPITGAWSAVGATGTSIDDSVDGAGVNQFNYTGAWAHLTGGGFNNTESRSAATGDTVSIAFVGTQIKLYGVANTDGGYGSFTLVDGSGGTVASGTIDFYSKYRDTAHELEFASPLLKTGSYTLKLTVLGDHSNWSDKAGDQFGSTGNYVSIDRAVVSTM